MALYPTWQPQARDFGSTTTTSDNTVLTWHSRYEISLVEVILVLNFKILKLTDDYMQKSGQTIGFGVPPPGRWLGTARPPTLSLTGQSGCTSWKHQTSIDPSSGFGHRNSLPVLPLRLPQCGNYDPCILLGSIPQAVKITLSRTCTRVCENAEPSACANSGPGLGPLASTNSWTAATGHTKGILLTPTVTGLGVVLELGSVRLIPCSVYWRPESCTTWTPLLWTSSPSLKNPRNATRIRALMSKTS